MTEAILNLGASIGDKKSQLHLAVCLLNALPNSSVLAVSRLYASPPMGPCVAGFFNLSLVLETALEPYELLASCQSIENRVGRLPSCRWADRVIDIDILFWGDLHMDDPVLTIPHPGILSRAFALKPTIEIRPNLIHPVHRLPLSGLLSKIAWPCWPVGVLSLALDH